mmetsp:Transcript_67610/g.195716  ORF Transcript_67610/g.195716 Transcript_67610/m.195716 type:complete len:273 (-) Transcript_67610:61-879(-)
MISIGRFFSRVRGSKHASVVPAAEDGLHGVVHTGPGYFAGRRSRRRPNRVPSTMRAAARPSSNAPEAIERDTGRQNQAFARVNTGASRMGTVTTTSSVGEGPKAMSEVNSVKIDGETASADAAVEKAITRQSHGMPNVSSLAVPTAPRERQVSFSTSTRAQQSTANVKAAVQRTMVELPDDFPRCKDWPDLNGEWRACNPDPRLATWLLALKIQDGVAVDGDGAITVLRSGAQGPCLHDGDLRRQGDCLIRTGRSGRTQLFIPRCRSHASSR